MTQNILAAISGTGERLQHGLFLGAGFVVVFVLVVAVVLYLDGRTGRA